MLAKHVALLMATAFFIILGLGVGFAGAEVEGDSRAPISCGSLLTPDASAKAFKHGVDQRVADVRDPVDQ
ncbi:MAG: hypothetical protein ACRDQF_15425 [Thermocrispum sp.]